MGYAVDSMGSKKLDRLCESKIECAAHRGPMAFVLQYGHDGCHHTLALKHREQEQLRKGDQYRRLLVQQLLNRPTEHNGIEVLPSNTLICV